LTVNYVGWRFSG